MLYEKLLKPLLFSCDPETAHSLACSMLPLLASTISQQDNPFSYKSPRLRTNLLGMELDTPLGLAAGFDKNGRYINSLAKFGFSFIEVGSVQAVATKGNPRPRLFRLPDDQALINRLGLNGEGVEAVVRNLSYDNWPIPVGINISRTNDARLKGDAAIEDVLQTFRKVLPLPAAYITINISCPNTEEGQLQEVRESTSVLEEVQKINALRHKILVKLSPDSPDQMLETITESAIKTDVSGYVCGNTTMSRSILSTSQSELSNIGSGGVSGRPLKPLAIDLVRRVNQLKSANQIIIGVGGINTGQDVLDFLNAGALAVEAYTGFVYRGPAFCAKVCRELDALLSTTSSRSAV